MKEVRIGCFAQMLMALTKCLTSWSVSTMFCGRVHSPSLSGNLGGIPHIVTWRSPHQESTFPEFRGPSCAPRLGDPRSVGWAMAATRVHQGPQRKRSTQVRTKTRSLSLVRHPLRFPTAMFTERRSRVTGDVGMRPEIYHVVRRDLRAGGR